MELGENVEIENYGNLQSIALSVLNILFLEGIDRCYTYEILKLEFRGHSLLTINFD